MFHTRVAIRAILVKCLKLDLELNLRLLIGDGRSRCLNVVGRNGAYGVNDHGRKEPWNRLIVLSILELRLHVFNHLEKKEEARNKTRIAKRMCLHKYVVDIPSKGS